MIFLLLLSLTVFHRFIPSPIQFFSVSSGADITNAKLEDAGPIIADAIRNFMYGLGVDDGISAFGYSSEDIPKLVEGTLPQHRVTKLAPAGEPAAEEYAMLYEKSMKIY